MPTVETKLTIASIQVHFTGVAKDSVPDGAMLS